MNCSFFLCCLFVALSVINPLGRYCLWVVTILEVDEVNSNRRIVLHAMLFAALSVINPLGRYCLWVVTILEVDEVNSNRRIVLHAMLFVCSPVGHKPLGKILPLGCNDS